MARAMKLDSTIIYRFVATHTGVFDCDWYPHRAGDPFEDVKVVGPYTTKIAWNGWVPNYGTFKVERQQLGISDSLPFQLKWHTIETKYYESGEQV